ncbi:hypothetical protein Kisp01_69420 [Kineosporia sp. NBRC 101677]|uniref:hypothetical protein n=1 Tax=Kineosporia sp. NBRC 101677 TaxID=3032197 RepID=UPI0024A2FBCB|nr:hypothetical protein [Kineosporia sp. NBRC 101677]GLY19928.1 hypothetical protein Kisp01_69420 [Kineosporia sp. NBRC 101677]
MNIETELRTALVDEATFAGDREQPYPAFLQRERKNRRTRRIRVASVVAAVVAVVGAAANVQALGAGSDDHSAPASEPERPSLVIPGRALVDSPLRGSLAKNEKFLNAMLPEVAEQGREAKLLYASDVGDWRLVLAYVAAPSASLDDEPTEESSLSWFTGPRGASAKQLDKTQGAPGDRPASAQTDVSNDAEGIAVVVGPVGYSVELTNSVEAHYTAQGKVERGGVFARSKEESGIVERVVPPTAVMPSITATLNKDGKSFPVESDGMTWEETGVSQEAYTAKAKAALGDSKFDAGLLGVWVKDSLASAALPLEGTKVRVRYAGKFRGQKLGVFTLQQPGQGVLAFAHFNGPASSGVSLQLLLPAEGADSRPIAYHPQEQDGPSDETIVVAPEGAARVTVTVEGEEPVEVDLKSGIGMVTVDPAREATATAYATGGSKMGSTPVRALAPFQENIGDSPETRVVP